MPNRLRNQTTVLLVAAKAKDLSVPRRMLQIWLRQTSRPQGLSEIPILVQGAIERSCDLAQSALRSAMDADEALARQLQVDNCYLVIEVVLGHLPCIALFATG